MVVWDRVREDRLRRRIGGGSVLQSPTPDEAVVD